MFHPASFHAIDHLPSFLLQLPQLPTLFRMITFRSIGQIWCRSNRMQFVRTCQFNPAGEKCIHCNRIETDYPFIRYGGGRRSFYSIWGGRRSFYSIWGVLPTTGVPASELVALMREFHAQDVPRWKDGKASGAVRKLSSLFRRQDTPPRILHARRATLHPQLTCFVCARARVQVYHGGEEHMALQDEVSESLTCHTPNVLQDTVESLCHERRYATNRAV